MIEKIKAKKLSLDKYSEHCLEIFLEQDRLLVKLVHNALDRRSILHSNFKQSLFFQIEEQKFCFETELDETNLQITNQNIIVYLGKFEQIKLATIKIIDLSLIIDVCYTLSPFETRFLAQNGFPHPVKEIPENLSNIITTDLHTHFAGCVSAKDLIKIGKDYDISYPVELLELAGIHTTEKDLFPLNNLSAELQNVLAQRLSIPLDRRVPFVGMEKIYKLRAPITKNTKTFVPLCRQIAKDYQAMGVKYIELSFANSIYSNYLELLHKELPKIEAETGLTIRFLAAIGRSDDLEWDLDYIEQLKQMSASYYIVGVDFLGHETNSTYAFAQQITEVAKWADQSYPGFVIRVHAGENPAHPENIRAAIELTKNYKVQLRIGHGLFGVNEQTLEELKSIQAIVEFNLNSNLALNNIQTIREVPIKEYLDREIAVVLGTDGYGIYQTGANIEVQAALLAGLTKTDLDKIYQSEKDYLLKRKYWDKNKEINFSVPSDLPKQYYTPEVLARKQATKVAQDQALLRRLEEIKIPLLSDEEVNNLLKGKQVISIAGAWYKSWEKISLYQQEKIYQLLDELFSCLDPKEVVIVIGGTKRGIANVVEQRAIALGFTVLATLVKQTPPMWLEKNSATFACIVAEDLYDKAAGLYKLMKQHHAVCLFIGGGNIVSDEIQAANNLRLNYLLMKGPEGASSLHAEQCPERAFSTAKEVLIALDYNKPWHSTNEPYWHLGANLTVDIVLIRNNPETKEKEVLLIRRDDDALAEPGKWALPGGFQLTDAPYGAYWQAGKETAREACVRELLEETSLDIKDLEADLIYVGSYEGEGRDPRDRAEAWSRSTVFALHLPDKLARVAIAGNDDACDACWIKITPFPTKLAFDHNRILKDALQILNIL